jgi:hypothetical protein
VPITAGGLLAIAIIVATSGVPRGVGSLPSDGLFVIPLTSPVAFGEGEASSTLTSTGGWKSPGEVLEIRSEDGRLLLRESEGVSAVMV